MKARLKTFLESDKFIAFCIGFMSGIIFLMTIRALHFWTWGKTYPLGY
jgi:hypothetical protein